MKYFVYWNKGSCNDGDHSSSLDAFDTVEEATERVKELMSNHFWADFDKVQMIKGTEIYTSPEK